MPFLFLSFVYGNKAQPIAAPIARFRAFGYDLNFGNLTPFAAHIVDGWWTMPGVPVPTLGWPGPLSYAENLFREPGPLHCTQLHCR
jgi:hypothetical protein